MNSNKKKRDSDSLHEHLIADPQPPQPAEPVKHHKPWLALLLMNLCCLLSTVYNVGVKFSFAAGASFIDLNFYRAAVTLMMSAAILKWNGVPFWRGLTDEQKKYLFLRSVVGQLVFFGYTLGLKFLSVSTFTIVLNIHPFWANLFAVWLLSEPLSRVDLHAIVLCFGGVVLVSTSSNKDDEDSIFDWNQLLGLLFTIAASILLGLTAVLTRKLKDLHQSLTLFWYSVFGVIVTGTWQAAVVASGDFEVYEFNVYLLLVGISVINALAMTTFTAAFRYDMASRIVVVTYIAVVYAFICDIVIFDVEFGARKLAGAILIFVVNIAVAAYKLWLEWKKN